MIRPNAKAKVHYDVEPCTDLPCTAAVWHHGPESSRQVPCRKRARVRVAGAPFCPLHAGLFITHGVIDGFTGGDPQRPIQVIDPRRHEL